MKKLFVLVVGMLLCAAAFAQEPQPYKVYCDIISNSRALSNKVDVELDFGQAAGFWTGDRRLYDQNGKAIVFNSTLDAANYMAERGWVFKQAYTITRFSKGDSGDPTYHWIMGKTVTDKSQITEGFLTAQMIR